MSERFILYKREFAVAGFEIDVCMYAIMNGKKLVDGWVGG